MQRGCMKRRSRKGGPDVWPVAKAALMSGSFAGPRPPLTVSVFTERKLSAQSSNILMKKLCGAP